jgi:hypothetical protein
VLFKPQYFYLKCVEVDLMKARLFKLSPLLMGTLLLLPGCGGDILKQNTVMTNGGCTSAYRAQSAVINQITNVTCTGTAATQPNSAYPTTGTTSGYPNTSAYPNTQISQQPIQGGQAVATPNGYAYQGSPLQNNPYAGSVYPTGTYGTNYGTTNPYGSYPANPSSATGYQTPYTTGTTTGYGSTAGYGQTTQGYGTTPNYGSTYGTAPTTGYAANTSAYGTAGTAQNASQNTGYIQYNVSQAQKNQAKR